MISMISIPYHSKTLSDGFTQCNRQQAEHLKEMPDCLLMSWISFNKAHARSNLSQQLINVTYSVFRKGLAETCPCQLRKCLVSEQAGEHEWRLWARNPLAEKNKCWWAAAQKQDESLCLWRLWPYIIIAWRCSTFAWLARIASQPQLCSRAWTNFAETPISPRFGYSATSKSAPACCRVLTLG